MERKQLSERVHRYVLASPLLDDCLEEWGTDGQTGVEIDFWVMPSGELDLVRVEDATDGMRACIGDALAQIRLPVGSVRESRKVTVSIR